jgi:uncharacterized low-complexity protein
MNNKISTMSAMIGAAFVASASLSPLASAAEAGFGATNLQSGYTLADNHASKSEGEHKCGEAKCGAEKKAEDEHKCGEGKCGEGKCGEGKCAGHKKTDGEHKCGEGKCGADKKEEKKAE